MDFIIWILDVGLWVLDRLILFVLFFLIWDFAFFDFVLWILYFGFGIVDLGCGFQIVNLGNLFLICFCFWGLVAWVFGFRILDFGDFGCYILDFGFFVLGTLA